MSTPAVTQDASAVSERHAEFLPTDRTYRLTGQLPADTEETPAVSSEEKKDAETTEASAASESEIAAASEAATQEKQPQKTAQTSESRWAKITRENRELRDRIARIEGAQTAMRDTKQTSQPAAEAKQDAKEPGLQDKDDKGEFKYKTLEEYQAAVRKYDREQILAQVKEENAKTAKERELTQAKEEINRELSKRVSKARKDHPDYDAVTSEAVSRKTDSGQDVLFIPEGSAIDVYILDSERGHDVLYEVCKNLDQHAHIFAHDAQGKFLLSPLRQVRELAKIEASLDAAEKPAPPKPVTQAARPPNQVSGKGTVAKDAVEQAVTDNDSEAYIRETNARILARRKQGK